MSSLTLRANSSRPALTLVAVRARRDLALPLSQARYRSMWLAGSGMRGGSASGGGLVARRSTLGAATVGDPAWRSANGGHQRRRFVPGGARRGFIGREKKRKGRERERELLRSCCEVIIVWGLSHVDRSGAGGGGVVGIREVDREREKSRSNVISSTLRVRSLAVCLSMRVSGDFVVRPFGCAHRSRIWFGSFGCAHRSRICVYGFAGTSVYVCM